MRCALRTALLCLPLLAGGHITTVAAEIQWVSDAVVQQAKQATVILELGTKKLECCGFFVSADGLVVTPASMLQGHRTAMVRNSRGERIAVSSIVGMDAAKQVAVLATGRKPPAFLKLNDLPAAIGSACVVMCMTPENNIEPMDVLLSARALPGRFPELRNCETWSLATKPPISGTLGGALISAEGKAVGMCAYWGMLFGTYPQPLAAAVTEKTIASALDSARSGGKARPFPSSGEIIPDNLNLGPEFEEATRLIASNDPAGAIPKLEQAIQQHPADPRPLDHLAGCLKSTGRLREARETAEQALRLDPDHPIYQGRLAGILEQQGELAEAQKLLRSMTAKFPNDPFAWSGLADHHMTAGQIAEAEACIRKACELAPDSMNILEKFRQILLTTGKVEEASQARDRLSELESIYFKLKYSVPKRQ